MSDAVRPFRLSPAFLAEYEDLQPEWGPVGYITYKRTYARTKEDGTTEEFWETCKRVVEGCYYAQKQRCHSLGLQWDNVKAQRSAQEMFRRMWDFKWLPPGRGLWMMGTPYIQRAGAAALNNPLHADTPILTRNGWCPIGNLVGDTVEVLSSTKLYGRDPKGTSASPVWVQAKISDFEEQPCVEITTRDVAGVETKIVASVNHRWFRRKTTKKPWERVTSLELREGDYLPIVRPAKNYLLSIFGAQHGFFFGDGTRSNGELHQFGDSISVLQQLFGSLAQPVTHRREDEWVVRNCPRDWGEVPKISEDTSYLWGFLAGYFAADGCVSKQGSCSLSSSRRHELHAVQRLFTHIGVRTGKIRLESTSSNYTEDRELWKMTIHNHDLSKEFFLKAVHQDRWNQRGQKYERDYAKVISIADAGIHQVLCATVPEKEQFVIDGFILTSNCGFVSTEGITVDFADPFCWLMDMLMLGVGVGFDTKGAGIVKVQEPRRSDDVHVVEDSREGWVDLLRRILTAYAGRGSLPGRIDYSLVRPAGSPIRGFGGTASGPEPLDDLVRAVQAVLDPLVGQAITSDAIVDLCNLVGKCVVAGNVRRSAEIAFGDPRDKTFLDLKNPEVWGEEVIYDHRWASNNSIFAEVGMDYAEFAERTALNGEPGYEWLENARGYGRMGWGPPDFRDRRVKGANPCVEQSLEDRELCCLVETFPSRHDSYDDYQKTLKYAYLYAKSVTLMQTHDQRTNQVLLRNRRIGTSMSGIQQAVKKVGRREFFRWCDQGYNYLRELDKIYSDWLCVRESIKITSVKPSGTVSLLPGVTPGIHFPHSEYYIRRIRFQESHPLVALLDEHGYNVEEDKYSPKTVVAEFPIKEEHFDRSKNDISLWEQLEMAAQVQQYWADNQVSVTVTFKPEEAKDIKYALELYETRLKGVSFLPLADHGYAQAPYEEITKEQYEDMVSKVTPISVNSHIEHDQTERFCDGDTCVVDFGDV